MEDYRTLNKASWDDRAPAHAASPDYSVERFAADPAFISDVVLFDQPLLGDVAGLRGVHLQCHIGTDTISLARLGASMTGLDFSPAALTQARDLAGRTGDDARFVEADVYDAVGVLGADAFDLVFTGIGALCWLPSVRRWAGVVAGLLRPGGRLFIREAHPMLDTLSDPREDGLIVVDFTYFERAEPMSGTRARAREELLAAGGRPRRSRIGGVEALTASELRVARRAALGHTNRQIAQELFVTIKAVEKHLAGAYRKLSIQGRAELAEALSSTAG